MSGDTVFDFANACTAAWLFAASAGFVNMGSLFGHGLIIQRVG